MIENKQIVISKSLHKDLKQYCASAEEKIKEYTEAALEYAIGRKMTVEELKEKQYKDSYASTSQGGPMLRYGSSGQKTTENPPEEIVDEKEAIVEEKREEIVLEDEAPPLKNGLKPKEDEDEDSW